MKHPRWRKEVDRSVTNAIKASDTVYLIHGEEEDRLALATRFGVLLPHFGAMCSKERVIYGAAQLEEWGFDSVWVRDHLEFTPHHFEGKDTTFLDPFTTLISIATITKKITVGTATIIPFRHPLVTSQLLGGLSYVAGPGRLIVGFGVGTYRKPFAATELDYETRTEWSKEWCEVLRGSWREKKFSYHGEYYNFDNVQIDPAPPPDTPFWYGGSTPASVRRAIEWGDGWFPGRCPLKTFDKYLSRIRMAEAERGKKYAVSIIPNISVDKDRDTALSKVNVEGLLQEGRERKYWIQPFETADDLKGSLIAGNPDECITQIKEWYIDRGVHTVVFDLRLRPAEFDQQIAWIARDILPAVKELAAKAESVGST